MNGGPMAAGATGSGRAADDLFRALERQILDGSLREGQPLPPEREIVNAFGVSRTVVREAVKALANKGLVEARPRFRPVVRKPSADTAIDTVGTVVARLLREPGGVRNLFDTRIMIEAALVREAARSATPEHLEMMKAALDSNGAAVENSEAFYRTDIEFHGVLFRIPGNPVLPAIHRAYTTWLAAQWTQMPRLPDRNRLNHRSHTAIYRAICRRDADAAEAALRSHLDDAWEQVKRTFGEL